MTNKQQANYDREVIVKAITAWRNTPMLEAGMLGNFLMEYANRMVEEANNEQHT